MAEEAASAVDADAPNINKVAKYVDDDTFIRARIARYNFSYIGLAIAAAADAAKK